MNYSCFVCTLNDTCQDRIIKEKNETQCGYRAADQECNFNA